MTAPGVGFVTTEVVLSELAGYERFRNSKTVSAFAGLAPAVRQSGGKRSKDMRITKEGSGLLRWALVESAWRLVRSSPKWAARYARLKERKGKKRAIVAVARKLLCVLYAMLRTRTPYKIVTTKTKAPRTPRQRLVLVRTPTAEQTPATDVATPTTTHQNQTTTRETTKPRTTRENPVKTPIVEQPPTTEMTAPKTTRRRSAKTPVAEQLTTV
jgi:hypothetical protein